MPSAPRKATPRASRRDDPGRPARGSAGRLLALASLAMLAALPYLGTLDYPLLRDDRTLLDNRWLAEEAGVRQVFARDYWHGTRHAGSDLYRPLTVLSIAYNAAWNPTRTGFRVVNLALHAMVTWAVFGLLLAVQRRLGGEPGVARANERGVAAWSGAALFAVHPLASDPVLFVVGRAEMLAAAFGIAALLVVSLPARGRTARAAVAGGSSALLFLALGSKESAASWLVVLAVWCAVAALARRRIPLSLASGVGWLVALAAFVALRASVVGWLPHPAPWVDNPLVLHDPATRAANAVILFGRYLATMVAPWRLSVEHGFDQIPVLSLVPWGLPLAIAVAGGWLALLWALRRRPAAAFLWAFVPSSFAVTGNFVMSIGTIFAERLAYLPLAGFCGLIGLGLARAARGGSAPRLAAAALLVLLLATGAVRTARRAADFRDFVTHVEATALASPRAVKALANVGRTRLRLGRPAEAIEPLERAVAIWPGYPRALGLLADAHQALGEREIADGYRRRAEVAERNPSAPPED